MTRTEAMTMIEARLSSFDDDRVITVAEIVEQLDNTKLTRRLSAREQELLRQARADFAEGRTYSHEEMVALIDADLAPFGVPRSTE